MTKIRDFLGPYRLARLIRMGTSCQVWEGIESATGNRYALKVLRPDFRENKTELALGVEHKMARVENLLKLSISMWSRFIKKPLKAEFHRKNGRNKY